MRSALALLAAVTALPLMAQSERPPFTVKESGEAFWRLQDAVKAVGDGQGTIVFAPGAYEDCAVQEAGDIAYVAARPGSVVMDGYSCEGKAGLVFRGRSAHVEGLIFQKFKVSDKNGAGIRLEKGDLRVENSIFRDSEQGILTGANPTSNVVIERATFAGLGGCPGGMCSHSIYIGDVGSLVARYNRFERGTGGHYVKARATRVDISENSFDDTRGFETNYMIDLPAGSVGSVSGNEFVQGKSKENYSAFIAVGAEDRLHPSAGLVIANNKARFAAGVDRNSTFVADWTREPLKIANNQLAPGLTLFGRR